jgi:drug/metabolite transporter (DMT)-like permease
VTAYHIVQAVACVLLISVGQLLFKAVGLAIEEEGTVFAWRPASLGSLAAILYVCATVVWIWLLRVVPLTKAYPFMAMSFVLVSALSALFLGERVSLQYAIGATLVIAGVIVITRAG